MENAARVAGLQGLGSAMGSAGLSSLELERRGDL